MREERVYCSDLCLEAGEPMLGTATRVDVWVLLEYRRTWRRKATDDNDLPPPVAAWLARQVEALSAGGLVRPQFVRRPDRDGGGDGVTVFLARNGSLSRTVVAGYDDLLSLDLDGARMDEVAEPHYFVCTNGQRDLCCSRYGLPAWTRLDEIAGERAWQTTHVGGHRFAPNVLVLPQGALYGRVTEAEVPGFAETVEAGRLSLEHLRGRCAWPAEAQAAEALVDGGGTLKAVDGGDVTFETPSGERTVRVRRAESPWRMIPSCGVTEAEEAFPLVAELVQREAQAAS